MKDVFYGWVDTVKPVMAERLANSICIGDGKGNFFDIIPYEGRYDAQPLALFSTDQSNTIRYIHQPDLLSIKGQVRDIKWIQVAGRDVLMIARNKDRMLFYQVNQ